MAGRPPLVTGVGDGEPLPRRTGSFRLRIDSEDTAGAFTLLESSRLTVGEGPNLHVHTREDETFVVLDGRYRFFVGDRDTVAERGAVLFGPRGVPHRFEVAAEGSMLLHVFTPGGIDDYFRRSLQALEEGRFPELAEEFGIRLLG